MNWKEFFKPAQLKLLIFAIFLCSGIIVFLDVHSLTQTPIADVTLERTVALVFSIIIMLILDWPLFLIPHTVTSRLVLIPAFAVMGIYWYFLSSSAVWLYERSHVLGKTKVQARLKRPKWLIAICVIGWLEAIFAITFLKVISIALIVTIYWLWKLKRKGWLWTIVLESIAVAFTLALAFPFELNIQSSINVILPTTLSLVVIIALLRKRSYFRK